MTDFFYQIGPIITREYWVFPTNDMVDAFFSDYIPEFKRIFGGDPMYELYFHGSCRDRYYGNPQTFIPEYSYDVDLLIYTNAEYPNESKIYDALCSAVRIGFKHKLLIDICCKKKPYYIDYEEDDFMKHRFLNIDKYAYRLNPSIYKADDVVKEIYLHDIKEVCLVKCKVKTEISQKVMDKIKKGWRYYKPVKIA